MAIQFVDGSVLFVGTSVAMHEDCCCEAADPCDDCAGTQPSCTVTLDVGCGGSCTAAGVYTFSSYTSYDPEDCAWEWVKGDWYITVYYTASLGGWGFEMSDGTDEFTGGFDTFPCVSGDLTDTKSASSTTSNCNGCTATIVFG